LYTSVAERTREIGTLKALGATNMNILALFLTESILIGLIGATFGILIGIGAGYLLSTGTSQNENDQPITPIYLAENLLSVWIVSVLLSTVSGLLPSMKASKTLPIEALRPQ
jgi:putative ABC transport system permease protein